MAADLGKGVIVILSGGGFDEMNPPEVRERMDDYITKVNADPFVQSATGGQGLAFQLLPGQTTKHLHQSKWRKICDALKLREASPLIVVGHSNGGAAAMDLARCLQTANKTIDLLISCDSVVTLDDIGNVYKVPSNVRMNINSFTIPTLAWLLAPFPIGRANRRDPDDSLSGILNAGLKFNLPGALGHRNAFYDLAGGADFEFPFLILEATLASLQGQSNDAIIAAAQASLQTLATKAHVKIEVSTAAGQTTLNP